MTIKEITLENLHEEFILEDKEDKKSKPNHNWEMFCKMCREHEEEFRKKLADYKKDREKKQNNCI